MSGAAKSRVTVNFHGLGKPHDGVPPDEAPYWLASDRFARVIDRIAVLRDKGHEIEITFDDGNRSDIEIGAPRLLGCGLRGSFFVLSGRLGRKHYLDPDDLQALVGMGMDVGLHGRDHVDWRKLDESGLQAETIEARARIAEAAGRPVLAVGIPFGAYNRRVMTHLQAQDFDTIYTSDGGQVSGRARVQPRTSLRSDMTPERIEAILRGLQSPLSRVRRFASAFVRQRVL